ncbi:LRC14 protein, partial [Rhabdornis inornatus]|nr:LRC14 protein [Rhabdornis inornatus]
MDSLLFLCARRIIAQRPLPSVPAGLYPVLFQVAFLDGRPLVLQDLVATWPFPVLHFQRLLGRPDVLWNRTCFGSVQAIIQAVVAQLQRELEEPGSQSSLRVLDTTRLPDSVPFCTPTGISSWCTTRDLAKACMEVSKHQKEFQSCGSKPHKGRSGADMVTAAPQAPGVDIHTDLYVSGTSCWILHEALQAGATGLLRLKCREFQADNLSASKIVTLLESLDPSCLRRVCLVENFLGLKGLLEILPHLSRFPELRSLKLWYNCVDLWHLTPESTTGICCVAKQLGMLPSLREFSLGSSKISGNLRQILSDLQAPLESLELAFCSLIPDDLAFLSESFHAPAIKRLDLSGLDVSQGLLEPLRLLLEKTSASLLYLNLMDCHMNDSHLDALLPTLLRCSRLRYLRLHGNSLSTAALKDLLQKTLELPDIHKVLYPCPVDCYKQQPPESRRKFVHDRELFEAAVAEFSQILANSGRTDLIWTCTPIGCEALDYFSL